MGLKDWFKSVCKWWGENAKANEKKISGGFSWLLIIIISNLMVPLIALLRGNEADWAGFLIVVIIASVSFLIMLIESIFGKREAPPQAVPQAIE